MRAERMLPRPKRENVEVRSPDLDCRATKSLSVNGWGSLSGPRAVTRSGGAEEGDVAEAVVLTEGIAKWDRTKAASQIAKADAERAERIRSEVRSTATDEQRKATPER